MAKTQTELTAILNGVVTQQKKTAAEITGVQTEVTTLKQKIADLEAAVPDDASPELEAAVEAVKAQAQVVDDEIPDQVTPPEV